MDDSEAGSLEQIRAFLAGSGEVRFAGAAAGGGVQLGGADAGTARVRKPEPAGQGFGAELHRTNDGSEPGAGDAADHGVCARPGG